MRAMWLWGGMTVAIFAGVTAAEEPATIREMTVTVPEIEVRCQPGEKVYATSKLRKGDRVLVRREEAGDWLAIEPPRGSFSWINNRLIQRYGSYGRVTTEAPVRVGSSVTKEPPSVEQVKLDPGTQVIILGNPMVAGDGSTWWPIKPPAREARFIPKSAVVEVPAVAQPTIGPPAVASTTVAAAPTHPLWIRAEQAVNAGNIADAIYCYEKLYSEVVATDHDLAMRAVNRANALREGNHGSVHPNYSKPTDANFAGTSQSRSAPPPVSPFPPPQPATVVAPVAQPQPTYTPRPAPVNPVGEWSNPGWLVRSAVPLYGQQAYVLEDRLQRLLLYVVPGPGLNLAAFVNRPVRLFGTIRYENQLRNYYITVTSVSPL